jgi:hypothetical protein
MKAKLTWIIPVILLINLITYELTIQEVEHKSRFLKKSYTLQIAKNIPSCLNISFTQNVNNELNNKIDINKYLLLETRKSKEKIYKIFEESGFTRSEFDSFVAVADNYIKKGNLTYQDMFMLLNYEDYTDHFFYQGYREGINSLNPESMKGKNVARIVIDSFDNKNTCQYFNAHKSFLFKIVDEGVEIGLFNTYQTWAVYRNAIDWVIFKLEDYYFNPGLRNKKEKIIGPYDENINISMEETKKGN